MDAERSRWCWDLVFIGCGASKRAGRSIAGELYTGTVFAAHRQIAEHLGLVEPEILSAQHGVLRWTQDVDPYEATLDAAASRRLAASVMAEIEQLLQVLLSTRSRAHGVGDLRFHRDDRREPWIGDRFGPPQQPAILVLAGAPYIDCWADQARALGVRVDDPLRGLNLGERRTLARRLCAETPGWRDVLTLEHPDGWGTRSEHLQGFIDQLDLERVSGMDFAAEPEPEVQGGLDFWGGGTPPTSPVGPPGRLHLGGLG